MKDLAHDLRLALRSLRRSPAFVVTALLTLALGIGLTSAIFSLVEATLLRPLPFAAPGELVQVWEAVPERGFDRNVVNPGNFLAWRESAKSFSELAAFTEWTANLAGDGSAERVPITYVTTNLLATLGRRPLLGRDFAASDAAAEAADVVLLSEGLWRARYAADPAIVGREIVVNGRPATVVGVLDRQSDFPLGSRLWSPMGFSERARQHRGRYLQVVGRLAPGASLATADAEMKTIALRLATERPDFNAGWTTNVVALDEQLVGGYRRTLWLLLAATGVIVLLACANLAGLLLARHAGRQHDLAVRSALGAGSGELARLLFVESAVVALAGGAAGLAVARGALTAALPWMPLDLPAYVEPRLDGRVLAFALLVTGLTAILFGLAPSLTAARRDPHSALQAGGRRASGRSGHAARAALVVCEVALSLGLVAATGLLLRSLATLRTVDPGFRTERLLTSRIDLAGPAYEKRAAQVQFFERLERALAGAPGVEAVGSISWLPLGGDGSATSYRAADRPAPEPGREPVGDVRAVTPGFLHAAGARLVAGRWISSEDSAEAPKVVVVSLASGRELWPGEDPVGREIVMDWGEPTRARVVGVVDDLVLTDLTNEPRGALYWPIAQLEAGNFASLLVRTQGRPESAAGLVRDAVAAIDPAIPAASIASMEEVRDRQTGGRRFTAGVLVVFAALALTLAAIGLYGLLAAAVAARRRELGVRMALGADGRRLLAEVVGRGVRLVAIGVVLGLPLAVAAGRLVASQLYRTSPHDPATLIAAPLVLLAVGALACLLPARRAAGTDPAGVLREG